MQPSATGTSRGMKAAGALRLAAFAVLAAFQSLLPLPVHADPDSSNDSDELTISLAPVIDLGVDVDTSTVRFSLSDLPGTLALTLPLGGTAYLVSPATVTVLGNFNNQEVQVQAQSLDQWTVDPDETAGLDSAQLYALFSVDRSSAPLEAEFGSDAGRHLLATSPQTAGETQGSESNLRVTNRYEINDGSMSGGVEMDNLTVGTVRQLWLRIDAPAFSSVATEQRFVVTVTAVNGRTN